MSIRYQLTATDYARSRLTDIWIQASSVDRAAITWASHLIDSELRMDAETKGVPVHPASPDLRLFEVDPLRASFEVSPPDRLVTIIDYELIVPTP